MGPYPFALPAVALILLSADTAADRLHEQRAPRAFEQQVKITEPPPAVVVGNRDVEGVVGKEVRSIADENMGRIIEIVVDRSGQVRAAVIDFGGFLGVGNRKIAVDWNLLQFDPASDPRGRVVLKLTQDQVRAAPEYKAGKPVVIVGALVDGSPPFNPSIRQD